MMNSINNPKQLRKRQEMKHSTFFLLKLAMMALVVTISAIQIVSPSGAMANMVSNADQPFQAIYWTTATSIFKAGVDGSNATAIVTGLTNAWNIRVDNDGGKIYWTDAGLINESGAGKIQRANLDGTQVEDVVTGISRPYSLELDLENQKIYWTDSPLLTRRVALDTNNFRTIGKIQRANFDGSQIEDLVTQLGQPSAIALDTNVGKMFWTEFKSPGRVKSANLDGSEVQTVANRVGWPLGVAVDLENQKVYWATNFTTIKRANYDGTDVETLINEGSGTGLTFGINLDWAANKMYFAHLGPDNNNDLTVWSIRQANLDGTESNVIVPNPVFVGGLALGL